MIILKELNSRLHPDIDLLIGIVQTSALLPLF